MNSLPDKLAEYDATVLYSLFSPSMKKMIDVDPFTKTFVVREVGSQKPIYTIPRDYLKTYNDNFTSQQVKFISWHGERSLRLIDINSEPKLDVIIEIDSAQNLKNKEPIIKEVASCVTPFLTHEEINKYLNQRDIMEDEDGKPEYIT